MRYQDKPKSLRYDVTLFLLCSDFIWYRIWPLSVSEHFGVKRHHYIFQNFDTKTCNIIYQIYVYWWGVHLLSWKCFVLRSFWVHYWSLTVKMQPFFNFLTFFNHDWLQFTCQQQKSISAAKSSKDLAHTFEMRYHLMSESRFYGHIDHFSDWSWCTLFISRT
jgi:hypothetical protein